MLYWAIAFLVVALASAVLGFGGIAASAAGMAKVLFILFLAFATLTFLVSRRAPQI